MTNHSILFPVLAMFFVCFGVWLALYFSRIPFMQKNKIRPSSIATPEKAAAVFTEQANNVSNNFKNLFEMPVIFYGICLVIDVSLVATYADLALAWGFVILRVVHSYIQCTSNRVIYRFYAYAASSILVWILVISTTVRLLMR